MTVLLASERHTHLGLILICLTGSMTGHFQPPLGWHTLPSSIPYLTLSKSTFYHCRPKSGSRAASLTLTCLWARNSDLSPHHGGLSYTLSWRNPFSSSSPAFLAWGILKKKSFFCLPAQPLAVGNFIFQSESTVGRLFWVTQLA